ncbi:TetR family transcriptional regulator [Streptomyces boncukensis]|uniref:TetR family transcriptional regulator n=1 Tax=Streptomyces boncukensis TaxID=2711219 RepID=UPI0019D2BFD7
MEESRDRAPSGLREMTRQAVRQRIAETAIDLFVAHGYDQVTVDQIAAAVGMSTRSFNRYFPNKEDVVLGDGPTWGATVRDHLASRPVDEAAWESLRHAFEALLISTDAVDVTDDRRKRVMRVLGSTPALRAYNTEKHLAWAGMLTPLVAERIRGKDADLRAEAMVQASLACFDAAMLWWARPDETRTPVELLDAVFTTFER